MPDDVGEGDEDVDLDVDDGGNETAAPARGTALVLYADVADGLVASDGSEAPLGPPAGLFFYPDSWRAIRAYIKGRDAPRSKQNAMDALRRITKLIRGDYVHPAQIPWAALAYEGALTIRGGLADRARSRTITPGTANLTLSHLRGLIRTMHGMKLMTADQLAWTQSDVLRSVTGKRIARGRALSTGEEQRLRVAARKLPGYQGLLLDTAIVVATGAGLRREELAKLTMEGVGLDDLTVIGKGDKAREIPIDTQMREAMDTWIEERARLVPGHGWFFCSPVHAEKELLPWHFWSLVRSAAHTAFGDQVPCNTKCRCLEVVTGPHDFRRTFATRALSLGLDIRDVQRLMGHESPDTTVRYDKRDTVALFEKRRKIRIIA